MMHLLLMQLNISTGSFLRLDTVNVLNKRSCRGGGECFVLSGKQSQLKFVQHDTSFGEMLKGSLRSEEEGVTKLSLFSILPILFFSKRKCFFNFFSSLFVFCSLLFYPLDLHELSFRNRFFLRFLLLSLFCHCFSKNYKVFVSFSFMLKCENIALMVETVFRS